MNLRYKLNAYEKLFKVISSLAYDRFEDIYVVGGFVRDLFLDKVTSDIDFVIIGNVAEFSKELSNLLDLKSDPVVFEKFGTAQLIYEGMELQFTRARKEEYEKSSRNPEVIDGTLEDDLKRRDFTFNTLCISLNRTTFGDLEDPLNGMDDLKEKIIRTPLDPIKTFSDDPLRIMRLVRFATQLKFNIDPNTLEGAEENIERLSIISKERISKEFMKILESENIVPGLILLDIMELYKFIIPELILLKGQEQRQDFHHKDVWLHTLEVVSKISEKTIDPFLRLAALLHDIGKPSTKNFVEDVGWTFHNHEEVGSEMIRPIFDNLRLSHDHLDMVIKLIRYHGMFRQLKYATDPSIRKFIIKVHPYMEELLLLVMSDYSTKNNSRIELIEADTNEIIQKIKMVQERDKFQEVFKCPINGKEIMDFFKIGPGHQVGLIKKAIEDAIISGEIENSYQGALDYMKEKFEEDKL